MKNRLILLILTLSFLHWAGEALAADWYVDNAANGTNNGTSWTNAWQSFTDIRWGGTGVVAGDTLYISGGATSKTYSSSLIVGASGSSSTSRIWIRPGARSATPAGHDGTVIFRPSSGVAVEIGNHHYITFDGNDGDGNRSFQVNATGGFGSLAGAINAVFSSYGVQVLYVFVDESGISNNEHGIRLSGNGTYPHEVAYCLIEDVYQDGIYMTGYRNPSNYGTGILIHHNIIRRVGDDILTLEGGADVYDNILGPHSSGGAGHPDGIQVYSGYLRIFNNIWYNDYLPGGNCTVFVDHAFPDRGNVMDHVRIYNNVFTYDRAANFAFTVCIWGDSFSLATDIHDVAIVNNTIVDTPGPAISIGAKNNLSLFTNIRIENNIIYNSGDSPTNDYAIALGPYADGSTITIDNNLIDGGNSGNAIIRDFTYPSTYNSRSVINWNITHSASNLVGIPSFVNYTENDNINNDYRLTSKDTAARDLGVDLRSISNMDASWPDDGNGIVRPQNASWDLGAYEYTHQQSQSNPKPPSNFRVIEVTQ